MNRGKTRRGNACESLEKPRLINLYIQPTLLRLLDGHVSDLDTDRSKFIREAVREKMRRAGAIR